MGFFWELDSHGFAKNNIIIETIFSDSCFVDLFKDYKGLSSHFIILFTDDLYDLTICFKEEIQGIFNIFSLDFFIDIFNVQCLFRLISLSCRSHHVVFGLLLSNHFKRRGSNEFKSCIWLFFFAYNYSTWIM